MNLLLVPGVIALISSTKRQPVRLRAVQPDRLGRDRKPDRARGRARRGNSNLEGRIWSHRHGGNG